jgi:hypothetical protein
MAWPSEAGFLPATVAAPALAFPPATPVVVDPSAYRGRRYNAGRGRFRVFNAAEYRFYRSASAPPEEGSTPFATSSSLPHTPADTYADGAWYLAVSYFNGIHDSGFLPLGPRGERYLRLDLAAGAEAGSPPAAALDVRLEARAGDVVGVVAFYHEAGARRAGEWALAYTVDGSAPPEDTPDVTAALPATGLAVLDYDLPAQAHGVTVKVRLQTRRNDGTIAVPVWVYSDGSAILTIAADASGPSAPPVMAAWAGPLPAEAE